MVKLGPLPVSVHRLLKYGTAGSMWAVVTESGCYGTIRNVTRLNYAMIGSGVR